MNCFVYRALIATLLATTMAAQTITSLPKAYTYSNATAFMPEGSPFITFMFDLPMYEGFDDQGESSPLWGEMGMEKGSCNMQVDAGLIVCNIIQVFSDGQIMLQGTGNAAVDCTLHAIVGGTGVYAGLSGSANECDLGNDVVSFEYELSVDDSAAVINYSSRMLAFVAMAVATGASGIGFW